MNPPLIGITADRADQCYQARTACAEVVGRAGGVPILLPCLPDHATAYVERCDGVILSGGDDPIMEHWGVATHPQARPISPQRQAFELAMLEALEARADQPVLGICLGMQLMGLYAGGTLEQYLPESIPTAGHHWPKATHRVTGALGDGEVHSHHRQGLTRAGTLQVVASAPDGLIEAVRADQRPFYLGVQWHPERTEDEPLGIGLVRAFVEACTG